MIQRKQSLYLLLMTFICLIMVISNLPVYMGTLVVDGNSTARYTIFIASTLIEMDPAILFHTNNLVYSLIINALVSFVSVFLYKGMAMQLKLTSFSFLFLGLSIFFLIYNYYQLVNLKGVSIQSTQLQLTIILPLILIVLNILAYRGIKKDIQLLASVDRLR